MAVRGVLLDLKGVLYEGGTAIDGAPEAVHALSDAGYALCFLTNTTTAPRQTVDARLRKMGLDVEGAHLLTPLTAAARWLADKGKRRLMLAAAPELADDLRDFDIVEEGADAVVMGDLGKEFDYAVLDQVFTEVKAGATLVALHKNRFTQGEGQLHLDLGPFVAAVEYAAEVEAQVMGKPSPAFFEMALAEIGVKADEALMVGDDLDADIRGAILAGLRAVQPQTGKYRPDDDSRGVLQPEARIPSIADLPAWLERNA